jgi:phosphate transport system substrate-binding protein
MRGHKLFVPGMLCLVLAQLISCSRPDPGSPAAGTLTLHGAGATFPAPLYARWIDEYRRVNPDVNVRYASVGSGLGTEWFLSGELPERAVRQAGVYEPPPSPIGGRPVEGTHRNVPLHFGASDAGLTDEQKAKVSRGAQVIPSTAGMIVLAFNLPGVYTLKLSRDTYADIFLGKVTRWNDPRIQESNPEIGLPPRDIAVVTRLDSSGTTYAFTNHLATISESWRRDFGSRGLKLLEWPGETFRGRGNIRVAGMIQGIPYSIGYVEFGVAERAGLTMATLQNRAGDYVEPSGESGRAALNAITSPESLSDPAGAAAYPIVTYTWLLAYGRYDDPAVARATKDFLGWCLTDGQQYAEELGYLPLDERDRQSALAAVASIAD